MLSDAVTGEDFLELLDASDVVFPSGFTLDLPYELFLPTGAADRPSLVLP